MQRKHKNDGGVEKAIRTRVFVKNGDGQTHKWTIH
jgi:hypothetical protein